MEWKMKTFCLEGTMIFEAEDVQDACLRLAQHFINLADDNAPPNMTMLEGSDLKLDELKKD